MARVSRQKSDSLGSKDGKPTARRRSRSTATSRRIDKSGLGQKHKAPTTGAANLANLVGVTGATGTKKNAAKSIDSKAAGAQGAKQRQLVDADIRAARRAESAKRAQKKNNLPFVIIGIILFLAVSFLVLYLILINTNIFEIKRIEVKGTEHLTTQEAEALVSIPLGTTLINVDTASIKSSLERDAWIKDASIERVFPDELIINVEERQIGAVVEVPIGINQTIQDWAIADDGMWLMAIPERTSELGSQLSNRIYEDADAALHIQGVPYGVSPQIGSYCTDDSVNNALEIISSMTTDLKDRVKSVRATDADSTLLTLDNNVEISFGDATNIREKERICLEIMEENPNVVYINVRIPDRPTWRSV